MLDAIVVSKQSEVESSVLAIDVKRYGTMQPNPIQMLQLCFREDIPSKLTISQSSEYDKWQYSTGIFFVNI